MAPEQGETPEELLQGGPGTEPTTETEETQEPEYVTIRLNGKSLQVTTDVADAIAERERDAQRKISEQGAELGSLRQQVRDIEGRVTKPEPTGPAKDPDLEFFEAPTSVLDRKVAQTKEEVKAEIRAEYEAERRAERFWDTFYKENPTLRGKEVVVRAVLHENWSELEKGEGKAGRDALAHAALTVLGVAPAPAKREVLKQTPPNTERPGGGLQPARTAPASTETKPGSMTELLIERRRARRAASTRVGPRTQGA